MFGAESDEVIRHYEKANYVSRKFYEKDADIRAAVDFITCDRMLAVGQEENLVRLQQELLNKDWFMTLLDFKAYTKKKEEALKAYEDRTAWAKKMLVNIAKAGYFSSDRTIEEYNRDIWKLEWDTVLEEEAVQEPAPDGEMAGSTCNQERRTR